MQTSPFAFVVCQVGAEAAVKEELSELRFAYGRPGFLTFKHEAGFPPDFELRSVFARAYGASEGKTAADPAPILALRDALARAYPDATVRLHAFERDRFPPGESPKDHDPAAITREIEAALAGTFDPVATPAAGDPVVDVAGVEPGEWWFGWHLHSELHAPGPGGRWPVPPLEGAPSRAGVKLEEVLAWSGLDPRAGEVAVELGSAPGGASHALLLRGLTVYGVDPAEMAPSVVGHASFRHVKKSIAQIERADFAEAPHWLLLDMNVKPEIGLDAVERALSFLDPRRLRALILTLKLNDWKHARRLPAHLARIERLGFRDVRAAQLSRHARELAAVATR